MPAVSFPYAQAHRVPACVAGQGMEGAVPGFARILRLYLLALEHHDPADGGGHIDFDNLFGPVRVQRPQVLPLALNDQLLERGLMRAVQAHHHVFAVHRGHLRVDKDQIAVMEPRFHADAAYMQHEGPVAAAHRTGQQFGFVLRYVASGDLGPFPGLHPGDQRAQAADIRLAIRGAFRVGRGRFRFVGFIHPALGFSHAAFQPFGQFIADPSAGAGRRADLVADLAEVGVVGAGDAGEFNQRPGLNDQELEVLQADRFQFAGHAGSVAHSITAVIRIKA